MTRKVRMPRFMWITISRATGYERFARRRKDLTGDSLWLHGPFKVRTDWLAREFDPTTRRRA